MSQIEFISTIALILLVFALLQFRTGQILRLTDQFGFMLALTMDHLEVEDPCQELCDRCWPEDGCQKRLDKRLHGEMVTSWALEENMSAVMAWDGEE